MRVLKFIAWIVAGLVLLIGMAFALARLGDGPTGLLPGGPLVAGELIAEPVSDWGFATSIDTIEMQLDGDETSRTTWILVKDGQAYIPCSLGFPPGKDWYLRADENGDAVVRIEGNRYPVRLVRLRDESQQSDLVGIVREKYGGGPPSDAEVWFFAVQPRVS